MDRIASLRGAALLALALAATVPSAARAEGYSAEYGAEAEARFVALCAAESGRSASACGRIAEALQGRLGYEGFLAGAHRGLAGFGTDVAATAPSPANPILVTAAPSRR